MDSQSSVAVDDTYFEVEKILDMKIQDKKKLYLVKWLNWDVKTCTWQHQKDISHLKALIKEYHQSKKYDLHNNMSIKAFDKVEVGMSPYEATKYYGHFLYGDEPAKIIAIQVIVKNNVKILNFEIQWKPRQNGFKPNNSLIEASIVTEHSPKYIIAYYESRIRLIDSSQLK